MRRVYFTASCVRTCEQGNTDNYANNQQQQTLKELSTRQLFTIAGTARPWPDQPGNGDGDGGWFFGSSFLFINSQYDNVSVLSCNADLYQLLSWILHNYDLG